MKATFTTHLQKFGAKGEKTGWTYIEISEVIIKKIAKGQKKSFRVKGNIDAMPLNKVAVIPMGDGTFILAVNGTMRKILKKKEGDIVIVTMETDTIPPAINEELLDCLAYEPAALSKFESLNASHCLYFSKWVESAKTIETRSKRIAEAVNALSRGLGFPEMLRERKKF